MKLVKVVCILIIFIFFSCSNPKTDNQIYGSWSAMYIYVSDNEELLGYGNDNISYMVKPAIFTKNGRMIIDLRDSGRIQANFELLFNDGIDSIILSSKLNKLNGKYKISYYEKPGKLIMVLSAENKQMYFHRLYGNLSL